MIREAKRNRYRGVTLVGTLVAVVILLIALIGTSSFRYYAALDGRRADAQTVASRIALTLCESWRGINGDETYNPVTHLNSDLGITASSTIVASQPSDFNLLGAYTILFDDERGVNRYMATLSWKDIQPGLRALNVNVAWAQREQVVSDSGVDKSFSLTIYTLTW
jgi:Tfp pilus assembly protein PilE